MLVKIELFDILQHATLKQEIAEISLNTNKEADYGMNNHQD